MCDSTIGAPSSTDYFSPKYKIFVRSPGNYPAKRIIDYLGGKGFKWFSLRGRVASGKLDVSANEFDGNFVACPEESLEALRKAVRLTAT